MLPYNIRCIVLYDISKQETTMIDIPLLRLRYEILNVSMVDLAASAGLPLGIGVGFYTPFGGRSFCGDSTRRLIVR